MNRGVTDGENVEGERFPQDPRRDTHPHHVESWTTAETVGNLGEELTGFQPIGFDLVH